MNGTPLQYSCLENPMDAGAWWAAVHGVARSRTWISDFTFPFHFHALEKAMATHSSVLAWRIPGTGEPGGLLSMESCRVGHDWSGLAAAAAACMMGRGCLSTWKATVFPDDPLPPLSMNGFQASKITNTGGNNIDFLFCLWQGSTQSIGQAAETFSHFTFLISQTHCPLVPKIMLLYMWLCGKLKHTTNHIFRSKWFNMLLLCMCIMIHKITWFWKTWWRKTKQKQHVKSPEWGHEINDTIDSVVTG